MSKAHDREQSRELREAVVIARELRQQLRQTLLAEQTQPGWWRGSLSPSALSTALAAFALHLGGRGEAQVRHGAGWLGAHANADGGWGDTPDSPSNLSTTLICWCVLRALSRAGVCEGERAVKAAGGWLETRLGTLSFGDAARSLVSLYGGDRTFSAPILALCALTGAFDEADAWRHVPGLPFELALLPSSTYRLVRLPVVSYALPALIAVGICRYRGVRQGRAGVREWALRPALRVLNSMQPESGGFLEAIPLTAFVAMCLVGAGMGDDPSVDRGLRFLLDTARSDGSWAIDSDLSGWLTAMIARNLACEQAGQEGLEEHSRTAITEHLLDAQHRVRHPFTGAAPGGWGWTDLPGGVPDVDDTAASLLALAGLSAHGPDADRACEQGAAWLLGLQNRDGGMPTFCRGWGRLPFDRSCPDLSAHALEALVALEPRLGPETAPRAARAVRRLARYLVATQSDQGTWTPLWFGSQARQPDMTNPVFGTSRVVLGLRAMEGQDPAADRARQRAERWLLSVRSEAGGWGSDIGLAPTIEETGLALAAISPAGEDLAAAQAIRWLADRFSTQEPIPSAPIGLYFARLWYGERLYPWIFALEGTTRFLCVYGEEREL